MILTWLLTPIGRYVGLAIIVALAVSALYVTGRFHGGTAAVQRIEKQNEAVKKAAGKETDKVKACFARGESWEWDTSTGTCIKMENAK